MSSTDTETQAAPTPVQESNASAALPGAGGASAAYGDTSSAAPAATAAPAAPTSEPYATMTTPTQVGVQNPQARPTLLGKDSRSKDDYAGSDAGAQPAVKTGGPATIEYDIRDRTTATGMQPQAIKQLNAAADFAGQAGLSRIVAVAGRGPGHRSHGYGTEWDLMGYNADGSKWTREQRVAVAQGARSAGATRFGFYEYGASYPTMDGRLHIGSRGPAATWGAGGYVKGDRSRQYTNEAERAFSTAFYAGQDFDYAPFLGQSATMTAEAQNQPGTVPYADDPFGVSASKSAANVPTPPTRPVPTSALAFAEEAPAAVAAAADPTRQVLSTASVSSQVLERGRVLERGARGAAATEWQTFLNMHGFTDASGQQLVADGDFGRRTREATKAFQEWAQIGVDGRVGPETLSAALYLLDPSSAPLPGKVAYDDGAVAAKKIIAPAEVDMPAYRPRPERGANVLDPRVNPRRDPDGFRIDVTRPALKNKDGSISTEQTATFKRGEVYLNIPTIVDGKRLSPDEAYQAFEDGRNAPVQWGFRTEGEAVAAAKRRSDYIRTARATNGDQTAEWTDVDAMTEVDADGNYVRSAAPDRPRILFGPADIARMTSDFRDGLIAGGLSGERLNAAVTRHEQLLKQSGSFRYASGQTPAEIGKMTGDFRQSLIDDGVTGPVLDRAVIAFESAAKRTIAASSAARQATQQRLHEARTKDDRFRPRPRAADTRSQDDVMLIRSSEAVREFARGVGDAYRQVTQKSAAPAPPPGSTLPAEIRQMIDDAMLRASPSTAETVTDAYSFGPRRRLSDRALITVSRP